MHVAQRYGAEMCAIAGCVSLDAPESPEVLDKGASVRRRLTAVEAELRGLTLSTALHGRTPSGSRKLLCEVPVATPGGWYVIKGRRMFVTQRLRLAHWLPLAPQGVCATPQGMLRLKNGSVVLRGAATAPGWSQLSPDAEASVEARMLSVASRKFDPVACGCRRVTTADESMRRLLRAALRAAASKIPYAPACATLILHRALATGVFPGRITGGSTPVLASNSLAQCAQRRMLVHGGSQHIADKARLVHESEWGAICPVHTPDGDRVGLTRHMSAGAAVALATDPEQWEALAEPGPHALVVNGIPRGRNVDGRALADALHSRGPRDERAVGLEVYDDAPREAWLWCDADRLLVRAGGRLHDVGEYAQRRARGEPGLPEPERPLSVVVETLPLVNYNQAARSCFSAAQTMQASAGHVDAAPLAPLKRVLRYAQRPLLRAARAPADGVHGCNVTLAVCSYEGDNMEDALVVSQNARDFGMFATDVERTHVNPLRGGMVDDADNAPAQALLRDCDATCSAARYGPATVARSVVGIDANGQPYTAVTDRHYLPLAVGDKWASRHGQKGVVARVVPREDLPFCPDTGITPDLLFNAHGIPSRMSVGQIQEIVLARLAALEGRFCDIQPWEREVLRRAQEALRGHSLPTHGATRLVDGKTGVPIRTPIMMGLCFYMHMPHVAREKSYSRAQHGAVHEVFRQPLAGRGRDGGMRLGEMEVAASQAAGLAAFLKDKLFHDSDGATAWVCPHCGAADATHAETAECARCNQKSAQEVALGSSVQAMMQHMQALGIGTRMQLG